jgi:hypothetical protein
MAPCRCIEEGPQRTLISVLQADTRRHSMRPVHTPDVQRSGARDHQEPRKWRAVRLLPIAERGTVGPSSYDPRVPLYVPLIQPRELPKLHAAIERPVMDWKVKPRTTNFERARDVARFANHLGGTLLLGAHEHDGHLQAYVGFTPAEAGAIRDSYSKAVAERCRPHPALDFAEYEHPDEPTKRIVAINVEASLDLIGVRVIVADKSGDGYGGDAFVFPVRSGTDQVYLEPGQLAMFMTPQIRRSIVMLARIAIGRRVTVHNPNASNPIYEFEGVFEEQNVVRMKSETRSYYPA